MENNKGYIKLDKYSLDEVLMHYVYRSHMVIKIYNEYLNKTNRNKQILKRLALNQEDKEKNCASVLYYDQIGDIYTYDYARAISISDVRECYASLLNGKNKEMLRLINDIGFNHENGGEDCIVYDEANEELRLYIIND